MSACKACGGPTEWEPDVGSNICTQCGTLEDASQVVLASQLEPHELGSYRDRAFPGASLKSLRAPGWNLVGQGKEARDARNKVMSISRLSTNSGD
jgi:transcription factor IIIB subunit 2